MPVQLPFEGDFRNRQPAGASIPFSEDWSDSPAEPRLGENDIHVWRAFLDCESAVLRRLEASLAPDEKSRAARFVFPRDRDHFIAARGILRATLGMYLQRIPADVVFTYGPQGKPALLSEASEPLIRFNLSHSHGTALYAFARSREVGVDLEKIRPEATGDKIAERFFSARELNELRSLPAEVQATGFFLCWTRKEAYVKALGGGLGIPLDSFDVSLTPGEPEELRSADSNRWSLRSIQPADRFVGAVVGEGKGWGLRLYQWNWDH